MKLGNQQEIQSYVAGLFDAEGWFTFGCSQKKYWNPIIGFVNINTKIIDYYLDFLKLNNIKFYLNVRKRKSWYHIQTSVFVCGDQQVDKWLDLVGDKLVIKKNQANIIKNSLDVEPKFRYNYKESFQSILRNEIVSLEAINKYWLIGFWEGDGSASIIKRNYRGEKIKFIPRIRFFTTSLTGKNSIQKFFEEKKIPCYIEVSSKNRNKPKYIITILGLKRCLNFCNQFKEIDLNGKIGIIKNFCERRLSLTNNFNQYSYLDIFYYQRLKILNDHTSEYY